MQKKLLTVAVAGALAMPVAAMADVTVYGTIDGGIRNQSKAQTAAGDDSNLVVTDGLRTTNRLGFKGSEDLGGGMRANFTMEGQHNSDDGARAYTTSRKSLVGVSTSSWSVDIGRDYTVNFKTQGVYDPMSYTYTGITPTAGTNTSGVRWSNQIVGGFNAGVAKIGVAYTTAAGAQEGAPGDDTGDGLGANVQFAVGPVTLAAAFSSVDENNLGQSRDTTNFGGVYKMGAFTFRAGWSQEESEAANTEQPLLAFGVQYGFSPTLNGRFGYYSVETKNKTTGVVSKEYSQMLVALDYYLSKSTTAYVMFDRLTIDTGVTHNLSGAQSGNLLDGATGLSAGVVHAF